MSYRLVTKGPNSNQSSSHFLVVLCLISLCDISLSADTFDVYPVFQNSYLKKENISQLLLPSCKPIFPLGLTLNQLLLFDWRKGFPYYYLIGGNMFFPI